MDIKAKLSEEFNLKHEYASNIVDLIDEGNTIPFIARYRKEMHGVCDDQVLRAFSDRLAYLVSLQKRKEEVRASIESQGKWTDELATALDAALTLTEVEDIYRPYKQKRKTRASVAIEKGLEPLADVIIAQELKTVDLNELTAPYINEDKGVLTSEEAVNGALDIIAERISDDAALRKSLRTFISAEGTLAVTFDEKQENQEKKRVYEMYAEFSESIKTLPSHRILAINRGENEQCLKVAVKADAEAAMEKIKAAYKKNSAFNALMDTVITDSYNRLIFPSLEREIRNELTDAAAEQAIRMFEQNLKPLLMQPPLKDKVIMGLDPAYRTGCKIAVIDKQGNLLDHAVVYPTPPQKRVEEAKAVLKALILKHGVDCISIGNGTASKESEIFVAELIKEIPRPLTYAVVNEAGASVYSAGEAAAEEFPELDLTLRSAVSIARRLLDPLAELIKIDVKSIGVGQYQHDMPQRRLTEALEGVVEDCVNSVGVNLNTASYSLLAYVAGLNMSIAKNIVSFRKEAPFTSREQLRKVSKLGPKAYEQCAGFLRVIGGENVLDNTAVHPESYTAAQKLLEKFGYTDADVKAGKLGELPQKIKDAGTAKTAAELGVGEPTLNDIISELIKPGRDIREDLPPPLLRADIMDLSDLKEGMEIVGTVRNVIDFGAFVDIGVHQDGLVHVSEISDNFIRHPGEALKVGDVVKVRVLAVDTQKKRISLSMKSPDAPKKKSEYKKPQDRSDRGNRPPQREQTLEEKLQQLAGRFNKY